MARKGTPIAVKVALYYKVLSKMESREAAAHFGVSHQTALKFCAEAASYIASIDSVKGSDVLRNFFTQSFRIQIFSYERQIDDALYPVIASLVEKGNSSVGQPKESGDYILSTRVSKSVHDDFQLVYSRVRESDSSIDSPSALLKKLVTDFLSEGVIKRPAVSVEKIADLENDLQNAIRSVLDRHRP